MAGQEDAVVYGRAHLQGHADQVAHEEHAAVDQAGEDHVDPHRALDDAHQYHGDGGVSEGARRCGGGERSYASEPGLSIYSLIERLFRLPWTTSTVP